MSPRTGEEEPAWTVATRRIVSRGLYLPVPNLSHMVYSHPGTKIRGSHRLVDDSSRCSFSRNMELECMLWWPSQVQQPYSCLGGKKKGSEWKARDAFVTAYLLGRWYSSTTLSQVTKEAWQTIHFPVSIGICSKSPYIVDVEWIFSFDILCVRFYAKSIQVHLVVLTGPDPRDHHSPHRHSSTSSN